MFVVVKIKDLKYIDLAKPKSGAPHFSFMLIGQQNTLNFSCAVIPKRKKTARENMWIAKEIVSWLTFLQREDFNTTFTDSPSCSILSKASLLSSRRVLVKLQLLKKTHFNKLLLVATRQNFPCKYTFLTDSNASLWLFSSVNHESFLEIYFA